jgi:hypothetical protein
MALSSIHACNHKKNRESVQLYAQCDVNPFTFLPLHRHPLGRFRIHLPIPNPLCYPKNRSLPCEEKRNKASNTQKGESPLTIIRQKQLGRMCRARLFLLPSLPVFFSLASPGPQKHVLLSSSLLILAFPCSRCVM